MFDRHDGRCLAGAVGCFPQPLLGGAAAVVVVPVAFGVDATSKGGQGGAGGSGHVFDWSAIPAGLQRPFLLAGGITPDNVHDAIQATRPWAVDVASGIEAAPGIKDGQKMRRFVAEVRRADCSE